MKLYYFILFFAFFLTLQLQAKNSVQTKNQPNFVFILADDCTHWDLGCYGSADAKTPNIDKLASQGMKFTRCYQAAPMCSPTRHNIYTGMYPVKTGAYPNHTMAYEGTKSVAHYLKPLGYRVALSGKTHIAPQSVFDFEYLGKTKNPDFNLVEKFLAETVENRQPFCLYLTSNEPHEPWDKGNPGLFNPEKITLPPHYVDTKETREAYCKYLAEINYLDGQVGSALNLLEKYHLTENTLVIFASEQGNSFPFAKWTLYEAGVKSALIARLPGEIKAGTISNSMVEYADILPTFIEMAGGKKVTELDGKSLLPVFKNENQKIKDYSFSIHTTRGINRGSEYFGIRAVVNENYRYIWNLTPEAEFLNVVNNNQVDDEFWKSWLEKAKTDEQAKILINKYKKRPKEELYLIKTDKWCQQNLAEMPEYAEIKKQLRMELLKWMDECGDKGQQTEMEALQHMPKHIKN